MWLRLRQIALVAKELAPVEKALIDTLGIEVCYRDPGVATFGLERMHCCPAATSYLRLLHRLRRTRRVAAILNVAVAMVVTW